MWCWAFRIEARKAQGQEVVLDGGNSARQAEYVATAFPDAGQREVQADVETQEHNPELGQESRRGIVVHEAKALPTDGEAKSEITYNGRQAGLARGDGREDAKPKKQDQRAERSKGMGLSLPENRLRGAMTTLKGRAASLLRAFIQR